MVEALAHYTSLKAGKPNVIMQPYHVDIVFAFHGHWTKSFFGGIVNNELATMWCSIN